MFFVPRADKSRGQLAPRVRSPPLLREAANELRNLIRCAIEREMAPHRENPLCLLSDNDRPVKIIAIQDRFALGFKRILTEDNKANEVSERTFVSLLASVRFSGSQPSPVTFY